MADKKFDIDDPEIVERMKQFVESNQDDTSNLHEGTKQSEAKVSLPKDKLYETDTSKFEDPTLDYANVKVTDEEKELYLKSLLFDNSPFNLKLKFMNGKFNVVIRTRTMAEQKIIWKALKLAMTSTTNKDLHAYTLQLQKLNMFLSLMEINGERFSPYQEPIKLEKNISDADFTEYVSKLIADADEKFQNINTHKWNLLLKAFNIFEGKLAKLSNDALNQEDFLNPVG